MRAGDAVPVEPVSDLVVWGKVAHRGKGPPPFVTVDGVRIPGVSRVELRQTREDEDEFLPVSPKRFRQGRTVAEVVLTFVEDRDPAKHLYAVSPTGTPLCPLRPTLAASDAEGRPLSRDRLAAVLEDDLALGEGKRDGVVAALLDELAAVYSDEPLGALAQRLADRHRA